MTFTSFKVNRSPLKIYFYNNSGYKRMEKIKKKNEEVNDEDLKNLKNHELCA